jgi:hypothetical protein
MHTETEIIRNLQTMREEICEAACGKDCIELDIAAVFVDILQALGLLTDANVLIVIGEMIITPD